MRLDSFSLNVIEEKSKSCFISSDVDSHSSSLILFITSESGMNSLHLLLVIKESYIESSGIDHLFIPSSPSSFSLLEILSSLQYH